MNSITDLLNLQQALERKKEFVRDHVSPLIAAAKNSMYGTWTCEYMLGFEANSQYETRFFDRDELVLATVTDENGNQYRYWIDVTYDSRAAIAYDVLRYLLDK